MSIVSDPRFGPGYPNCAANRGRRDVRLDFGLGQSFTVEYQSGAIAPLLRAVLRVRLINDDPRDSRQYRVTDAGTFACRPINNPHEPGSHVPSNHSWPVAIDVNPAQNCFGCGRGDIPQWFIDCFAAEGFTWGGAWGDPMHFENLTWAGSWDGTYPKAWKPWYVFTEFLDGKPVATAEYASLFDAAEKARTRARALRRVAPRAKLFEVGPAGNRHPFRLVWRAALLLRRQLHNATPAAVATGRAVMASLRVEGPLHNHGLRVTATRKEML